MGYLTRAAHLGALQRLSNLGGTVFHRHSPYLTQSLADRWSQPLAVMSPWLLLLRVRVLACVCDKQRKTLSALCSLLYF